MNRPIKLRAWDAANRTLTPVTSIEQLVNPQLVISQFTGIYDARGVEVWEGDIIRWMHVDKVEQWAGVYHYLVCYRSGCFGTTDHEGVEFTPFSTREGPLADLVVGNVYLTPNQLTQNAEWEGVALPLDYLINAN
ncbi:hypothetical protein FAES_0366 [Fibrella aestuarina BUZ 2]|uniref:YopX protein domain-containing protein n=1 Tax=Fibrella aestuarina BUZ 2 TaxID=1166018 RepID=I0K2M5_9BACT|nr:YopX family protein [Fibrella aestuarina]CCG98378.1 hypothetical protein FAES_0366 [Fibrella aestuarina BUZ 2]